MEFKAAVNCQFRYSKTSFGFPFVEVDPSPSEKTTYQAGGSLQVVHGKLRTTVSGSVVSDPTGLDRWCGMTYEGKGGSRLNVITAYRTCGGSINTAPLGGTLHRESAYFRHQGIANPQPRSMFLSDLQRKVSMLQSQGNAVPIMLDANSRLDTDSKYSDMVHSLDLCDLHSADPAPLNVHRRQRQPD